MKEKVKKISKYVMNIMAFINAILVGLSPVWGWHIEKITDSITILIGIIGVYLVGGKIFAKPEIEENEDYDEDLDNGEW